MIKVIYNSEVVGTFSKLTLCSYKNDIKNFIIYKPIAF